MTPRDGGQLDNQRGHVESARRPWCNSVAERLVPEAQSEEALVALLSQQELGRPGRWRRPPSAGRGPRDLADHVGTVGAPGCRVRVRRPRYGTAVSTRWWRRLTSGSCRRSAGGSRRFMGQDNNSVSAARPYSRSRRRWCSSRRVARGPSAPVPRPSYAADRLQGEGRVDGQP
jgi:hypothetical protein